MTQRYNSTIILREKKCACGCGNSGYIYAKGMLKNCYLKINKPKPIAKMSERRKVELSYKPNESELDIWFEERRTEMTGKCWHCNENSCKDDDKYFKFSIAHILPKAYFDSVKTHPLNWIELCFWNKSCHTNFDNLFLDITELNCYNTVIERFIAMYPEIDNKEKKRIPVALLNYVNT